MRPLPHILGAGFARRAVTGLLLLLCSLQFVLPGQAWDGDGLEPQPWQRQAQFPGEQPGETEELAEDSADRLAWQGESATAEHAGLFPDASAGAAFIRSSSGRLSLLDRFLLRPPTVR